MAGEPPDIADAALLLQVSQPIMNVLRSEIDHCQLFKTTYAISHRLKSPVRMLEKAQSRALDKIPSRVRPGEIYSLDDLTDIIGIRFISLYRDEVPNIIRSLLMLMTDKADIRPNYFAEWQLLEFKVYIASSSNENDTHAAELRQLLQSAYNESPPCKFEVLQSRYSSIHMVATRRHTSELGDFVIPVEFQIRSVFEDVWGEIDHKLFFELDRRGGSDDDKSQRETLSQHLGILKKMLDSSADFADVIKRTLVTPPIQPVGITRSMEGAGYIQSQVTAARLSAGLARQIMTLMSDKDRIDSELESGNSLGGPPSYIRIADQLSDLVERDFPAPSAADENRVSISRQSLKASLLLEEALCRLLSEDRQQLRLAVVKYEAITRLFPQHPAGWLRLGQTLSRIVMEAVPGSTIADENLKLASSAYEKAEEAVASLENSSAQRVMSRDQELFVLDNLHRLHGFLIWRASDLRRRGGLSSESDLVSIQYAYDITVSGLSVVKSPDARVRLVNNAVYYAADAIHVAKELGVKIDLDGSFSQLNDLTTELELHLREKDVMEVDRWDTIVHIKELLGDHRAAQLAAAKVLDANTKATDDLPDGRSAYDREMRARAVQYAWSVYRTTG